MNNRFRLQIKAQLMMSRSRVLGTLRENGTIEAVFIQRNEVDEWKAKYGDRLTIWGW